MEYDQQTNTATLNFNAFDVGQYELVIDDNLKNPDGITLEAPDRVDFSAVSDFSALVDLEFTNTRSDRANGTVSFDVAVISNYFKYAINTKRRSLIV